jgi:hypothetical protein
MKAIKRLGILYACLLSFVLYGEGFVKETLVKTPSGYAPIETLQEGDLVICYDFQGNCVKKPITQVTKKWTVTLVELCLGEVYLYAAPDHLFYLPQEHTWLATKNIKPEQVLLKACSGPALVTHIREIEQESEVFDLTIADHHNFCVSYQDILVHNEAWSIGLGLSWTFGGPVGGIAFAGVTGSIALGGVILGLAWNHESKQARAYADFNEDLGRHFENEKQKERSTFTAACGGPEDPNDPRHQKNKNNHKNLPEDNKKHSDRENKKSEPKSPNQMNQQIKTGNSPRDVKRVDVGRVKGEQNHIHFKDGSALNRDGTWKHGKRHLSNAEKQWVQENGWTLPGD